MKTVGLVKSANLVKSATLVKSAKLIAYRQTGKFRKSDQPISLLLIVPVDFENFQNMPYLWLLTTNFNYKRKYFLAFIYEFP